MWKVTAIFSSNEFQWLKGVIHSHHFREKKQNSQVSLQTCLFKLNERTKTPVPHGTLNTLTI